MTKEIRWRIITLQVVMTLVLAFGAGVAFWAHSFTHDQVKTQLVAQQIVFPAANSASIKALPTAADRNAMNQYAGETMTNGYQAKVWAENYISVHLNEIGQGKTYAYYSGKALAEQATNPKQYNIDNGIALTLFRGETLKALLLNAYAFWFVGDIAFYAAIGLVIGALVTLGALLFELFVAPKREGVIDLHERRAAKVAAS